MGIVKHVRCAAAALMVFFDTDWSRKRERETVLLVNGVGMSHNVLWCLMVEFSHNASISGLLFCHSLCT